MMIAFAFVLGLVVGSFLNVCIHRLPLDESLLRPGSRCPRCRHPIAPYDNIPVLSFLLLRGRCRHCRHPISARYPAVEALTAALFAALAWRWSWRPEWAAAVCAASACLLAIAFIDWDTFLIPDLLSLGLAAAGLAASPLNPLLVGPWAASLAGSGPAVRFGFSAAGAVLGFALCWGIAAFGEWLFKKEA
ncbi:MAG: prepilin peptidase, partial [Elusimicrobia bacterium]|nr:prepilin peptidase [Elusimicrobiota bacterium]